MLSDPLHSRESAALETPRDLQRVGVEGIERERVTRRRDRRDRVAAELESARKLGVRELTIFDLEQARAAELAAAMAAKAGTDLAAAMHEADGLIHCTPTGMAKMPGLPLDAKLLELRHWVAEIVYVPLETELLRVARARGCRTVDGGGMAVFQAAGAFRLFTGLEPDTERMLRHFRSM